MEQREGYKKTKIGWIPEDWDAVKFSDIVMLNKRKVNPKDNEYEKCIELEHIDQGTGKLLGYSLASGKSSTKTQFKSGDILFGKLRPYLMKYCLPDFDGACSTEIFVFRSKPFVDNRFAFNIVRTDGFIANSVSKSFGTKMPRTNWDIVGSYSFPLPPLPEQQKIASILTTVDDKISSIDQQIQQTEQLKKGLMEKLLTEGIGHTEFKDTKIGRIPKEWDVVDLDTLVEEGFNITYGVVQPGDDNPNGVPFIRGGDIKNGKISQCLRKISHEISNKYKRTLLDGGELIIALVGYPGETAIVPESLRGANIARQVALVKIHQKSSKTYLRQYFCSDFGKAQLLHDIVGSAQQVINLVSLKKVKVVLPHLQEQKQLASILSTVDDKIDVLQSKKTSYTTLKKGLMAQLLTGQMRVKI